MCSSFGVPRNRRRLPADAGAALIRVVTSFWRSVLLPTLLLAVLVATPRSGPAIELMSGRPLRLEGRLAASADAPDVLEEITVSADGRTRRRFAVTALQAYQPEEEGAQVLRHSTLRPVTLLLRGSSESIRRFWEARPGEKVIVFGVYHAGAGTLTLGGVEVGG